ncbi:MAG: hypothetical protein QOJ90_360 [Actinomycetota bacterium]|jgi:capsular polysaccharide biosynthesis protein|nr:hypothetical protein [Actinomycetota bacterium]
MRATWSHLRPRVLRRLWIVALALAITVLAAQFLAGGQSASHRSWQSDALLVVNESGKDPLRTAPTYAAVISEDGTILPAVARAAGVDVDTAKSRLSVTTLQLTALLRVSYTGDSANEATSAVGALIAAVTGPRPVSQAIAPQSVIVVRDVSQAQAIQQSGTPVLRLALLLGLALGIVLAVALDRADPRVDDEDTVGEAVGTPVTSLRRADTAQLAAMLQRWADLNPSPARIALVESGPMSRGAANAAGRRLIEAAVAGSRPVRVVRQADDTSDQSSPADKGAALTLVTYDDSSAIGLAALKADSTVIVAGEGAPLAEVKRQRRALLELGASPLWCLVVPRHGGHDGKPAAKTPAKRAPGRAAKVAQRRREPSGR